MKADTQIYMSLEANGNRRLNIEGSVSLFREFLSSMVLPPEAKLKSNAVSEVHNRAAIGSEAQGDAIAV